TYHMALGITNLVYAPQLPGWPDGQIPVHFTSVWEYAQVMTQFLDIVKEERVDLVGHSFGGWIALAISQDHPERVSRLVLLDAMGVDVPDAPAADLGRMDEEVFLKAAFAQTGEVVIRGDFSGVRENVRKGQEFEKQWKSREIVETLVHGSYAD